LDQIKSILRDITQRSQEEQGNDAESTMEKVVSRRLLPEYNHGVYVDCDNARRVKTRVTEKNISECSTETHIGLKANCQTEYTIYTAGEKLCIACQVDNTVDVETTQQLETVDVEMLDTTTVELHSFCDVAIQLPIRVNYCESEMMVQCEDCDCESSELTSQNEGSELVAPTLVAEIEETNLMDNDLRKYQVKDAYIDLLRRHTQLLVTSIAKAAGKSTSDIHDPHVTCRTDQQREIINAMPEPSGTSWQKSVQSEGDWWIGWPYQLV
jgi:hypothetical protein